MLGAYGTFGRHVARLLASRGHALTLCGRDPARLNTLARELGPDHRAMTLEVLDRGACTAALAGHRVAIDCAGPYGPAHEAVLEACLAAGCHHVDLAEERAFNATVRAMGPRFAAAGLTAVHGASSLPGISGALAELARAGLREPVRARVLLWIGNRNVKGAAAIAAALAGAGRPIAGTALTGLGEPETVELPSPYGAVTARSFDSPEYDLFPERDVSVKVGFQFGLAGPLVALVSRLPGGRSYTSARWLARAGSLASGAGTSGGAVQVELWGAGGERRRAALVAADRGQEMAALPAVLAAVRLLDGGGRPGACTAGELLGATDLLADLAADGFRVVRE